MLRVSYLADTHTTHVLGHLPPSLSTTSLILLTDEAEEDSDRIKKGEEELYFV